MVNFGAINNQRLYNGISLFNPTVGTSYGGGYGSIICADPTCGVVRYDNTVEYKSPVISGFQVFGQYAAKQSKAVNTNYSTTLGALNGPGMTEISAKYSNGPIVAAATRLETNATGLTTSPTAAVKKSVDTFTGAYEVGNGLRLGAIYQKLKNPALTPAIMTATSLTAAQAASDRSTRAVNAIYTMGANTFMLTYGRTKEDKATRSALAVAAATGVASVPAYTYGGKSSKFVGLQYKYALSKMTALEARWERLDDAAGTYAFPAQFNMDAAGARIRTRSTVGINVNF